MQNPIPETSDPHVTSGSPATERAGSLDETLCAAAETTASLDKLLKAAAEVPGPSPVEEAQWKGLLSRLQDLDFVRKQSLTLASSSESAHATEVLGPFELLERLGEGGMGAVYRARHLRLGKIMAVKVMHSHRLNDQELRSRFYREMRALGQLQHPNIVSAQHADEVDGVPYLAMEYVDGTSLASLFNDRMANDRQLPISAVCELIRQAAEGIQYAHDQGVLHRDLKPGNLMLDRDGRVRVLDLGLARMTESIESGESASSTSPSEHLTSQHQILGTPGYMAPEQLTRGHEMDSRTDVYALGATAFFLLTGKRVHAYSNSESIVQHAMRVVSEPAPDVRSLRKDVPDELAALIGHALVREPQQRLQSAGELARGLSQWSSKQALRSLIAENNLHDSALVHSTVATERLPISAVSVQRSREELQTVVMPSAAQAGFGNTKTPRSLAGWIVPGGFLAVILLAGVLLKLQTNDGGELIIQSDDPDAKITVSAVQGAQSEELQLVEQEDKTLKLTQGKWAITIKGPDASGFELSTDTIVMSPGSRREVRVTRRKAVDSTALSDASLAKSKPIMTPSQEKGSAETPSRDASPVVDVVNAGTANGKVNWTPGRLDKIGWGLVPQPAHLDSVATWQMQLLRPPTGMCGSWYIERQAHLDPQRELIATCDEYGARITRISDARVIEHFQRFDGAWFKSITFSADGALLLLSSYYDIEIRRRDGRLVSRFKAGNPLFRYSRSQLSTTWLPNGHLLAWTDSGAAVYSVNGNIVHEIAAHEENKDPWLQHATYNDKGTEILLSGLSKTVFKWCPGDSALEELFTVDDAQSLQAIWSPDGSQILVTPQGGDSSPRLLSPDGTLLVTGKTPMYLAAWSPDGRFIVDGYGRVFSSETLEVLRTLDLPAQPGMYSSLYTPFWPAADEIVLISQSPNRTYASGSLYRFHPSGRKVASLEPPQLLSVGSATLDEKDSVRTAHISSLGLCGLGHWEATGKPLGVKFSEAQQTVRFDGYPWNSVNGNMAITHGSWGPVIIIDRNGKTVRSIPVRGAKLAWSSDGKRLSMMNYSNQPVEPYGKVTVYGESDVPEFESPPLPGYNSFGPVWSPDGRWLLWETVDPTVSENSLLKFVDMQSREKAIQSLTLPGASGGRWISFSPDSQWLAIFNGSPAGQTAWLRRMSDQKLFEKKLETAGSAWSPLAGCWAGDSTRVVLGEIFDVDPAEGLKRVGKFYSDAPRPQLLALNADKKTLWSESLDDRIFGIKDFDGQQITQFGASGSLRPGHADSYQARLQSEDHLLFLSVPAWPSEHTTSTGLLNLKEPGIRWTGLAYDNGQQITLSPGGEILHGPENIDQYVTHTINYPGGVITSVTRQELVDRATASPEQKAMLWANDLRAVIRIQDATEPWTAEPALAVSGFPAATAVVELDFSGHLQIADPELQHLPRFTSLAKLSLANTGLSVIPDFSGLLSLAELDLSQTQITSLTGLQNCQSLRKLELAGLQIDAASWQIIGANTGLENLNLSNTTLDSLSALDLHSLKSLKHLDVRGAKLSESDVEILRKTLMGCNVMSGPTAAPEE